MITQASHWTEWRLAVDTGGTFTDALAWDPAGRLRRAKVLSTGALRGIVAAPLGPREFVAAIAWEARADVLRGGAFRLLGSASPAVPVAAFDPATLVVTLASDPAGGLPPGAPFEVRTGEEAPVLAARLLTATPAGSPLPPLTMRLGTTLATNALLTRTGAPVAFFVTRGFGDLLEIGTQQRPELFTLKVVKIPPLPQAVVEVPERLAADGSVLAPLDAAALAPEAERLVAAGITAAAVALLHSDRNPRHEEELAAMLRTRGFRHVACSSALAREIRILPRAATAVVDAHLGPVVSDYLERIHAALPGGRLLVMGSAGGLSGAATARPKDLLLSGPAGGVVGAARAGRASGFPRTLSFDMGGTSTDVARHDGHYDYVFEHRVGDAHLFAPALAIETVAAGGGSICRAGGGALAVGPESAGADPGPACYGAGGPLTLTDVNLLLGRLDPARFAVPVDPAPAQARLEEILAALPEKPAPEAVLAGFLEIADERMADAIRRISIRRGYDPRDHALVAFGGAGGQHACAVAARLEAAALVVPADAGLLSAFGMAAALVERFARRQLLAPLAEVAGRVPAILDELAAEAREALAADGVAPGEAVIGRRIAELRLRGQESVLDVEIRPGVSLADAFLARYAAVYGHRPASRPVELVSLAVAASTPPAPVPAPAPPPPAWAPVPAGARRAWFPGGWREVPVYDRKDLGPGARLAGPALVFEAHGATVVEPGWRLDTDGARALVLRREGAAAAPHARPAAVEVELFASRFGAIAREMGEALRRTAVSTNVKERLDFSCALLDEAGRLVVNAPHIPVHLGSLGLCVRAVAAALELRPGDVALTNAPGCGGSHLPDLTVVAPVHDGGGRRLGYVAARAHHAEIGGVRPGSMPPAATRLVEEGVLIPPLRIVAAGEARWDAVERLLTEAPFPTRALADNLADIRAAVAACHRGGEALRALARAHGAEAVARHLAAILARSEARLREALVALPSGVYQAEERLDDGTPLRVRIGLGGGEATMDFTGTAGVHPGNLNATPAIVASVAIYVLRLLVREELPLNEGLLAPVRLVIPPGLLDPPFPADPRLAPAVVGGNVETSQRLVDLLLKALGLAAASQGTMNNVLFGDGSFSYYETVCGGCGAGPGFPGADAVHSHMTNTRITDPELLEHRHPVRLERFAVRRGSGGRGRWRGGDGVVREITFLAPLELSLLTQRRREGPYGLEDGGSGRPGAQRLVLADGGVVELSSCASARVRPGDRLVLETPGGGGYGREEP